MSIKIDSPIMSEELFCKKCGTQNDLLNTIRFTKVAKYPRTLGSEIKEALKVTCDCCGYFWFIPTRDKIDEAIDFEEWEEI